MNIPLKKVGPVFETVYADKNHIKISCEYIGKIRCLNTPLSRFAYKVTHTKIGREYIGKKH